MPSEWFEDTKAWAYGERGEGRGWREGGLDKCLQPGVAGEYTSLSGSFWGRRLEKRGVSIGSMKEQVSRMANGLEVSITWAWICRKISSEVSLGNASKGVGPRGEEGEGE